MSEPGGGRIVPAPEIGKVAETTFLVLPEPATLYTRRAARFRKLASGSPMGEYLSFIADVAQSQHQAVRSVAAAAFPIDEERLAWCLEHRVPLFGRSELPRNEAWRVALDTVLTVMPRTTIPSSAQAAMEALGMSTVGQREALADRCLRMTPTEVDLAPAVFVNAALQVWWSSLAALVPSGRMAPIQPGWLCPVCGSRPVASLIDSPRATARLRYLACSLCDSRWHYTRAICADCGDGKSVAYQAIEGVGGPARAETCGACESYVKLLHCDRDPEVDAFADDLASAGLDIMVQEAGWQRNAPNPFLLTS